MIASFVYHQPCHFLLDARRDRRRSRKRILQFDPSGHEMLRIARHYRQIMNERGRCYLLV